MGAKPAKVRTAKDTSGKKFDEQGRELVRVFLVESYMKSSGVLGLHKKFVWRAKTAEGLLVEVE